MEITAKNTSDDKLCHLRNLTDVVIFGEIPVAKELLTHESRTLQRKFSLEKSFIILISFSITH